MDFSDHATQQEELMRQQLRRGLGILRASLRIEERAVPGHAGKGGPVSLAPDYLRRIRKEDN